MIPAALSLTVVQLNVMVDRNIAPEDVADTIAFLASDRADMIQGQTIIIDGGTNSSATTGSIPLVTTICTEWLARVG